jgi:DNA integrity scanning protein DisA with diadenylate cyclase activity
VSSLNDSSAMVSNTNDSSLSLVNTSILTEFNQQLNTLANIRDYLMMFINNLTITDIDSIILQATTLVQLTTITNQLTRYALVRRVFCSFCQQILIE